MPAKFVMLPSQTGSFIVDAHRVVSARESPLGTILTTAERVDIEVTEGPEVVRSILGTLRFQAISGGVVAWFNHRYLDFASLNDAGPAIDGARLEAGLTWAKHGDAQANRDALVRLFASRWIAAQEEGEWDGDATAEGARDLDELTAVAAALATREEAPAEAGDAFLSWLESEIDEASLDIGAAHQEGGKATEREKARPGILSDVRAEYLALRAQPQARKEAQPVAWRMRRKQSMTGAWNYSPDEPMADPKIWDLEDHEVQPLFTTPPAPEAEKLRVAIRDIKGAADSFRDCPGDEVAHQVIIRCDQALSASAAVARASEQG